MNTGTARKQPKLLIDTNILISALVYGGKPEQVLRLILEKKAMGVTSLVLLAEFLGILAQKFHFQPKKIQQAERLVKKNFHFVYPKETLDVVGDEDDNRVLEAAVEGDCSFIVTGDRQLLILGEFRGIKIVNADQFLKSV